MLKYLIILMLLVNLSLFADPSQGETLERQMWEYVKDKKWNELENRLAPYFQDAVFKGGRSREQFMTDVKKGDTSDYKITNFIVTEGPALMIVTYDISVSEILEGQSISSNASRLSVWQKVKDDWKWVAHAILVPLTE